MVAEAEVVIGGEIDDALAIVGTDGGLLVVQLAQFEVGSALTEVVKLGCEVGELRVFCGCGGHGINRKPLQATQHFWGNPHHSKGKQLERVGVTHCKKFS